MCGAAGIASPTEKLIGASAHAPPRTHYQDLPDLDRKRQWMASANWICHSPAQLRILQESSVVKPLAPCTKCRSLNGGELEMKRLALSLLGAICASAAFAGPIFTSTVSKLEGPNLRVYFTEKGLLKNELVGYRVNADVTVVWACMHANKMKDNTAMKTVTTKVTASGRWQGKAGGTLSNNIVLHPGDAPTNLCPPGGKPAIVSVSYSDVTVTDVKNFVTANVASSGRVYKSGFKGAPSKPVSEEAGSLTGQFTSSSAKLDGPDLQVRFTERGLFRNALVNFRVEADITITYGCEKSGRFVGGANGNTKTITTGVSRTGSFKATAGGKLVGMLVLNAPMDHTLCPAGEKEVILSVSYKNIRVEDTRNIRSTNVPANNGSRQFHAISRS